MTGIKLTVSDQVVSRKGSTEAAFEKRIARYLKEIGVRSHHVHDSYQQGLPDRYVIGGNWIECKVIPWSGRRKVNPVRLFSTEQQNKLTELHEAGDRAWVAVQFQGEIDPVVVFMPWYRFKEHGPWDKDELEIFGWKDLRKGLHGVFGREIRSYSDGWFYDQ